MKNVKMMSLACLCLVVGLALIGCGGSSEPAASSGAAPAKLEFRMGSNTADNQVFTVTYQWVIDQLKARTNGAVDVSLFPNNVLGGELEMRDMVAEGTLEIAGLGSGGISAWEPASDLVCFLYVFRSQEEMYYVSTESAFGRKYFYDDLLAKKGVRMLDQWAATPRQLITTKPVRTLKDLQNLKVRMPAGILPFEKSWQALGALVVQIPLGDAFTGLQQGTVDGAEMPIDFIYNYQLMEACKYLTNTNHLLYTQHALMNENAWKRMSADQQKILMELMAEGRKKVDAGNIEAVARIEKDMKEKHGVQFIEVDAQTRAEFEKIAEKVIKDNVGVMFDQATYDSYLAAINEFRNKK